MTTPELQQLAKRVHEANIKWWQDPETGKPIKRNPYELVALIVSELSECLEGERRNLWDDKLPHRKMAEVEMADAYIRVLDFCEGVGLSVENLPLRDSVPANKGEALYHMMGCAVEIPDSSNGVWASTLLAMIRDYCAHHGYCLYGALEERMAFNATREDHKHEARRIAGGKQF